MGATQVEPTVVTMATTPHSTITPPPLDAGLKSSLRRVASRLRTCVFVEGIAWVALFIAAAFAFQFLVDYGTRGIRWSMRATFLAAIIGVALWLFWRLVLAPLRRHIGFAEIAHLLERRHPQLASLLISAVRFTSGQTGPAESNSPDMVASVVHAANRAVTRMEFKSIIDARRARRAGFGLIGLVVFGALIALIFPGGTGIWFRRNVLLQEVPWPRRTHLHVDIEGNELIAARGDDVVIEAYAEGVQPREVDMFFTTDDGQRGRETMVTVGSTGDLRYRYTFKNAQKDFTFHLEGGDGETPEYHARLLERPRVDTSQLTIQPPDYTKLTAFELEEGKRAAEVLPGTDITFKVTTNKPVVTAELVSGDESLLPAERNGNQLVATFPVMETRTFNFHLVDEAGLNNPRPVRFSIRVIKDEPPRIDLRIEGVGDMITSEAILPLQVSCEDEYGIGALELTYQLLREDEKIAPIAIPAPADDAKRYLTSVNWPVAEAAVTPGDRIILLAQAHDLNDVTGPNNARSAEYSLRVVTRDELLAELARREQEYRLTFERFVDMQEQTRADALTVHGEHGDDGRMAELAAAIAPIERRQRNLAGSVNVLKQQFEQVLAELRVNQLDTRDEVERLSGGVIEPLTELARRDLVAIADLMRDWSQQGNKETVQEIDSRQVEALRKMRSILSHMLQWEGYHEVINMMRDILRLQQELKEESEKALLEQAEDVFEN